MHRETLAPRPDWRAKVEAVGLDFHSNGGEPYWWESACYAFSSTEVDLIEEATETLHQLCLEAVDRLVAKGLVSRAESSQDRIWPHVLTLKGTGFLAQGEAKTTIPEKVKRPTARIPRQGADFWARTLLWWQPKIGQAQLTARIHYEAVKGSLFRLQTVVPANWEVERVEVQPAGLLRDWSIRTEGGRSMLTAQLKQPLVGGGSSGSGSCRLIVSLRQAGALSAPNAFEKIAVWSFPNMPIPEARWHECALAIGWDDQSYQGIAKTTAPVAMPDEDE